MTRPPGEPLRSVTARAPGSVGNLICGFDLLGLCLEGPADLVTAEVVSTPGVHIREVVGGNGRIPTEVDRNSAGVAVLALLANTVPGIALTLRKGLPLSGGMGGSAASAVAAVVAVDALLGLNTPQEELYRAAMEGEAMVSGAHHGDNVAPSLFGGIVLARPGVPVVSLPVPDGLRVALLHPRMEISTREVRDVLPAQVPLEDAVAQAGHTAALVAALHSGDWDLLASALVDRLAEPWRRDRIPGFERVREAAMGEGALGFGISGAGPSLVALCHGEDRCLRVGQAMQEAFTQATSLEVELHLSGVGSGARLVDATP